MIDYEKLKYAHELAEKLRIIQGCHITITHTFRGDHSTPYQLFIGEHDCFDEHFDNLTLDKLIVKLEELTKPEQKYKIGQKVWFSIKNEIYDSEIISYENEENIHLYKLNNDLIFIESELYPTKQDLIKAQIDYWQEQLGDISSNHNSTQECEHIPDDNFQVRLNSFFCIKCKEYYQK